MLEATGIHKSYGRLCVLNDVALTVQPGEVISLVGASGAGKSTLLHILGTLDKPDSGQIRFEGNDVFAMGQNEQSRFRNLHLGFVFQFHHLLPEFTALENVCLPAFIAGTSRQESQKRGLDLLSRLNMDDRKDHRPSELSGGEQQRVAIARAFVNHPKLILADEPTGNLDSANSEEIYKLIFELSAESGVGFVIATHSEHFASMAFRKLLMQDGRITQPTAAEFSDHFKSRQ